MTVLPQADWPLPLRHWVDERYRALMARCREAGVVLYDDAGVARRIMNTLLCSDFAFEMWLRRPQLLAEAGLSALGTEAGPGQRSALLTLPQDEADAMALLRRFRHGEALRLIFRDVNRLDSLEETLAQTSELYECLLEQALAWSEQSLLPRYGVGRDAAGMRQRMVVLGLGKLGGGELNFSSDIDLILAYPRAGQSDGRHRLDNSEYFLRQSRLLVKLLGEPTAEGICARIDLRLRPFGQVGQTALSFAAMEQYYQREGRDWERYAWIKGRPVAGDLQAGQELVAMLRPFVYRRYLDYTAFAGLREMKGLIDVEVARKDLRGNLKLGPGGIREIEFVVQLIQLIRGGRDPGLRIYGLLPALAVCEADGHLGSARARSLGEAYRFLRQLENRLQMLRDEQVHTIPAEPVSQQRIALGMGYPGWEALQQVLAAHRAAVSEAFAAVALPGGQRGGHVAPREQALWQSAERGEGAVAVAAWEAAGFQPGQRAADLLAGLLDSAQVRTMSAAARARLPHLLPLLLQAASQRSVPLTVLERLVRLIQAVARRPAYLALLEEQPAARRRLAWLFSCSAFLSEQLIAQPLLLDDIFDPRIDQLPLDSEAIGQGIARVLATLDEREAGAELERLNELKASLAFRLGLAFSDELASAMATAYRLAALAEAMTRAVTELAERELIALHGRLPGAGLGFAVFGYGSLGGMELGFASDLDLVFVYDGERANLTSDGERPLSGAHWYLRLAQRIINWLSVLTRAGRLYEVDPRLRPDGAQGLLVVSQASFAAYQRERAWTWEHQALLRARPVAGDIRLYQAFDSVREEVLRRPRERTVVLDEVGQMRRRWRIGRDRSDASQLDLKQGHGALIDIEFIVQALLLAHMQHHPALLTATDTPAQIEACAAAGLLDAAQAMALRRAHDGLLQRALSSTLDLKARIAPRDPHLQALAEGVGAVACALGLNFA